jgi:Glycosyltransferase family 92
VDRAGVLDGKSVDMVETASSWTLPENSGYRRESARPIKRRQANFEAQFDAHTVFYDCFRVIKTQVMLIGPPLNRFEGVLGSLSIHSLPTGSQCHYEVDHMFTTGFAHRQTHNLCRVVVEVPEEDTSLHLQSTAGETTLEIRPNACEVFRGRRVLFTLSKNNHPAWICDWMRFHRDLHNADAVLLYDNASTTSTASALLETMKLVSGFKVISVVSWPYKYGPQGVGWGTWDSAFSQDGAMEDARWRYLAHAHSVLNCDIDELVLSDDGSLFDIAAGSTTGCVRFSGRWVNALNKSNSGEITPRHRESTYQLLPRWRWKGFRPKDVRLCPTKWVVAPNRCPANGHWSVHEIVGMRARKMKDDATYYRHFSQINTNWKNNRKDLEISDRVPNKEDAKLQEAFAKVKWDE